MATSSNVNSNLDITRTYDTICINNYNKYKSHIINKKLLLIYDNVIDDKDNDSYEEDEYDDEMNFEEDFEEDSEWEEESEDEEDSEKEEKYEDKEDSEKEEESEDEEDSEKEEKYEDKEDSEKEEESEEEDDSEEEDNEDIKNITHSKFRKYNWNKSRIIKCTIKKDNKKISNKKKYRTILLDMWSTLPKNIVIKKTKFNILPTNEMGKRGYYWSSKNNMSIKHGSINDTMNEIIKFAMLYKFKIDMTIKLVNGDKIKLRV
jgi:hypothetical protein